VYVPGGWWHTVLNLDLTVAVTHNYCSSATFAPIWRHARRGRPKMSGRWLAQARRSFPAPRSAPMPRHTFPLLFSPSSMHTCFSSL
jgi:hypothetical protein